MNDIAEKELDDLFGIPTSISDADEEDNSSDEYSEETSAEESFDDQVDVLKDDLNSVPDVESHLKQLWEPDDSEEQEQEQKLNTEPIKTLENKQDNSNESSSKDADKKDMVEQDAEQDVEQDVEQEYPNSSPGPDKDGWLLVSPSPKYNHFYTEKAKTIKTLCPNGKIDIDKIRNELKEAHVDVAMAVSDLDLLYQKMTSVQHWKHRVQELQADINLQYFMWERGIDLIRGLLARTEVVKPAAKQEGIVYEHLQDMEFYYAQLKFLHKLAEGVSKNLDSAFDCLSRKVTISLPEKRIERYEQKPKSNISDYDEVPKKNSSGGKKNVNIKGDDGWDLVE